MRTVKQPGRTQSMIREWLVLNSNELKWIGLASFGLLVAGVLAN